MPLNTVYVGRPTKWGNPFVVKEFGLDVAIAKYLEWLQYRIGIEPYFLDPLRGKDLACWCSLDKPCHADVILKILNEQRLVKAPNGTELPSKAPNGIANFMEDLAKEIYSEKK